MSLFDLLKKDNNIYAPVNGECLDIADCSDNTFASKLMGDGFIVLPSGNVICSPASGTITMIFPTKHAFGIKMDDGKELLIHICINTVELKGQYFDTLAKVNQKVRKGTPIIKFDYQKIKELGYDIDVIVVCCGYEKVNKIHLNEQVTVKDIIIGG